MVRNMWENIRMILNMVMEFIIGRMVEFMMVCGKMVNNMEKGYI